MMFNVNKYREIRDFLKKNNKNTEIIAISKNHPKDSVLEAINAGVYIFGENRVMEAKNKFADLIRQFPQLQLHLTGPLQSNKVKAAISIFDVFHTIDREKIVNEFAKYKDQIKEKKFFIQVNTGEEKNKSGVFPKYLKEFYEFSKKDKHMNIIGLMCIPPIDEDPKKHFSFLKTLSSDCGLNEISIGMSNDFSQAIDFDPTYIRLGTILFGNRN